MEIVDVDSLWDGEMESFDLDDTEVLILKVSGAIRAYDGICPHQSFSLVEGQLEDGVLTCRAHGWEFDALTGTSINPRGNALTRYDHQIEEGIIRVRPCIPTRSAAKAR
ncbi:MAG: Rieske 2Fe-2S domain-containing protein [Actinomycetota bacterium]|nr:Rieske 2Fe-2S domain-containing protein [Actinomycetota bacterium]MDP1877312.1 Rieske 2Fe-2S domain-containing protein [Actinomycetota bacterium]